MITKTIYSAISLNGKKVLGQLIIVGGVHYIADENELNTHTFYGVNPDAFYEVLPESITSITKLNIFETEKKILKAQSPEEIDAITENLDKQTLKNVIKLLVERLTPINIKINRINNQIK